MQTCNQENRRTGDRRDYTVRDKSEDYMNTNRNVIVVDNNDTQIGELGIIKAHTGGGTLHRALSVLCFRESSGGPEILLQKRSKTKTLWGGFWTNTICTHPAPHETTGSAGARRLKEEMGIDISEKKLTFLYSFVYRAQYTKTLSEHEYDHIFAAKWNGACVMNPKEADDAKWSSLSRLRKDMHGNPHVYTPWFHLIMNDKRTVRYFDNITA